MLDKTMFVYTLKSHRFALGRQANSRHCGVEIFWVCESLYDTNYQTTFQSHTHRLNWDV